MKLKHKQPMWHSTFLHGVYKCLSTAATAVSPFTIYVLSLTLPFLPLPSSSPPHSLLHISAASHSCIPAFLHLPCSAPRYLSHTQQLAVVNDDEITTSDSPIPHHHPTAIIHHALLQPRPGPFRSPARLRRRCSRRSRQPDRRPVHRQAARQE
jgi:hypothetical protein